jgi:hypothetical protein
MMQIYNYRYWTSGPPRLHCEPLCLNFKPLRLQCEPPWLHFEQPELPNFDLDADTDPDLAFDFDADPTPAFHSGAVPDPSSENDADPIGNNGLKYKITSVLINIYSDICFTNRRRGTIFVLPILRFG